MQTGNAMNLARTGFLLALLPWMVIALFFVIHPG
jgi:hypothetical protein